MLDITRETVLHVISEPGDATRYDYLAIRGKGYDKNITFFRKFKSTFDFPDYILDHEATEILKDNTYCSNMANIKECNYWTLKECARTAIYLIKLEEL